MSSGRLRWSIRSRPQVALGSDDTARMTPSRSMKATLGSAAMAVTAAAGMLAA